MKNDAEEQALTATEAARRLEEWKGTRPMDWFGSEFVLIESPFKSSNGKALGENILFARRACLLALKEGMNPFAMHLFYPQFLDDGEEAQRDLGIHLGLQWSRLIHRVWFCLREGEQFSDGMRRAYDFYSHVTVMNLTLKIFDADDLSLIGTVTDPEHIRQRVYL